MCLKLGFVALKLDIFLVFTSNIRISNKTNDNFSSEIQEDIAERYYFECAFVL